MLHEGGREHLTVMEIICSYIRENAPALNLDLTEPPFSAKKPRTDIQVALTIIGRRSQAQVDLETKNRFRLDLRNADLDGCDFRRGHFSAAMFHYSRFELANFDEASLHGAIFYNALLNYASFWQAELVGMILDKAIISRPKYRADGYVHSINMGNINGISLAGTDLSALHYIGEPEVMNKTFVTKDTQFCYALDSMRADLEEKLWSLVRKKLKGETERSLAIEDELCRAGVMHWSPYDSSDLATGHLRKKFLDTLGLTGWPYQEA